MVGDLLLFANNESGGNYLQNCQLVEDDRGIISTAYHNK